MFNTLQFLGIQYIINIQFYVITLYNIILSCYWKVNIYLLNPLNAELNPICHLLALLGGATIVVVSRLRVKVYC